MKSKKRCPRCDTTKPASEFYVSKARDKHGVLKDRLGSYCKKCTNIYNKAREYTEMELKDEMIRQLQHENAQLRLRLEMMK